MQKQAPSVAKIASMVAFTLSCFGLLIFLWLSFGGPIPLSPEGYRFKARFTEAPLLVQEANVRISGLDVGKVKKTSLADAGGTLVEMEIDSKYAPLPKNTKAILRPKSLLGQTYVELTPGNPDTGMLHDNDTLPNTQVTESVDIDEVIRTFDKPTRRAFQGWIRELSTAIDGRSDDVNDALGNLPRFVASGRDVLKVLDEEEPALHRLVKNSGVALEAVNERRGQLRELVVNANDFFGALASRNEALAETIEIFPTFLDETKATIKRLETFATDTRPLVRDLQPVATDLRPTLEDLGELAPNLRQLFRDLPQLIRESRTTLPEAAKFLRAAGPLFEGLHPYLQELNPILAFANYQQEQLADFIMNGAGSLNATLPGAGGEGPRHYLRQIGVINSRGLAIQRTIPSYDRGNSYPAPNYLKRAFTLGIAEAWTCANTTGGGEQRNPAPGEPPCFVQPSQLWDGKKFPNIGRGDSELREPPKRLEGTQPPPDLTP